MVLFFPPRPGSNILPSLTQACSTSLVAPKTCDSNMAFPLGLASISRATRVPSAARVPLGFDFPTQMNVVEACDFLVLDPLSRPDSLAVYDDQIAFLPLRIALDLLLFKATAARGTRMTSSIARSRVTLRFIKALLKIHGDTPIIDQDV